MNLKNRQTLLAVVAGGLVVLFILDKVLFSPLLETWRTRSDSIANLRKSITAGQTMINRDAITRSAWDDMSRNTLVVNKSQAQSAVITALDQWSRTSRVTINSVRPQWKRGDTEEYSLLECRVEATGNIETLSRFLYEMERSEIALRVQSIDITARDTGGNQLTLSLAITGLRLAPLSEG